PQAAYEEDIHDGKEGLEDHLQHHRDGQQQDGAVKTALSEVLMPAAQGLAYRLPEGGLGFCTHGVHCQHTEIRSGRGIRSSSRSKRYRLDCNCSCYQLRPKGFLNA